MLVKGACSSVYSRPRVTRRQLSAFHYSPAGEHTVFLSWEHVLSKTIARISISLLFSHHSCHSPSMQSEMSGRVCTVVRIDKDRGRRTLTSEKLSLSRWKIYFCSHFWCFLSNFKAVFSHFHLRLPSHQGFLVELKFSFFHSTVLWLIGNAAVNSTIFIPVLRPSCYWVCGRGRRKFEYSNSLTVMWSGRTQFKNKNYTKSKSGRTKKFFSKWKEARAATHTRPAKLCNLGCCWTDFFFVWFISVEPLRATGTPNSAECRPIPDLIFLLLSESNGNCNVRCSTAKP